MSTITMPALKEVEGKIDARQKELGEIFAEAGPEIDLTKVKSVSGATDSKGVAEHIANLNAEMDELGAERDRLLSVRKAAERSREAAERGQDGALETGDEGRAGGFKSLGDSFTASRAFKEYQGGQGPEAQLDVELKTLFETTAGWAPESTRTGKLVLDAQRPIQVTDVVPQTTTGQAAVVFMEETTFTNNAAEASEGGTYGEAALALTEQSSTVRKIAVWLPVSDEQLEDEAHARGYVNNRLPFMLRQRLDSQILTGDGNAPNLDGFLNVNGIQTQAKGADPSFDAVHKAITKVKVTGRATPGAVIFHDNDWEGLRLTRTTDGIYILGNPENVGPNRIWGLQVVLSDAITEGTALVGDFANFTELAVRRGIDIQVTNAHSDFFIKGKQAIRADVRCALVVYRPAALATVTGL